MQITRTTALTFGSLVLAAPLLTGCAEEYATDYIYTPAAGVNDRDGQVDVLNAAIVSTDGGSGTFIASLANGSAEDEAALEGLSGEGLEFAEFEPVEMLPQGFVNLADGVEGVAPGPGTVESETVPSSRITVTGDFELGDFVPVEMTFSDGTVTEMVIPVLPNADEYAGIDGDDLTPTEFPAQDAAEEDQAEPEELE